jgi:hypothetical protein
MSKFFDGLEAYIICSFTVIDHQQRKDLRTDTFPAFDRDRGNHLRQPQTPTAWMAHVGAADKA